MTLSECLKLQADKAFWHPKLQVGVTIKGLEFFPNGQACIYYSHTPAGDPMVPYFGTQVPYEVKNRKMKWFAWVEYRLAGLGHSTVIPQHLADSNEWVEK